MRHHGNRTTSTPRDGETRRLAALRRLDLLDTPPEVSFDRITNLAARLFDAPVALVALIDAERQWFKSAVGLNVRETPRAQAFCAHTVRRDAPLVVPDATADPRFRANPLVTGPPHVRFYAGAPVRSPDGYRIGSLCVIDTAPRAGFSASDRANLRDLAAIVESEIANRAAHARDLAARADSLHDLATHLEAVVRASPLALVTVDPDGVVTGWNPAAERIFGWTAEEAFGRFLPFAAEEPFRSEWAVLRDRLRGGESVSGVEARRRRKDGALVDVTIAAAPLHDADGGYAGTLALVDDVTARNATDRARRQAEAALDATRSRLEAVLQSSADAVLAADAAGRITAWNAGAAAIFGYDAAEVVGRPLTTLMPPRHRAAHTRGVARAARTGASRLAGRPLELTGLHKAGHEIPIELTLSSWDGVDGPAFGAVVRDVAARKALEAERDETMRRLAAARDAAEAASRAKSAFLANMSHKLRTPLNAVIGFAEVMADPRTAPRDLERYQDYARDIRDSGRHLLGVIGDVLDLSKAESGTMTLDAGPCRLRDVVDAAVRMVAGAAAAKSVAIEVAVPADLPAVHADELKLRQATLNVLGNAVKFTEPGGRVTVAAAVSGRDVAIRIRDTGAGMDAAGRATALQPFGQVDNGLARRNGGVGLGLPLAQRLVALHGGMLSLDSEPGAGTEVTLTIPMADRG